MPPCTEETATRPAETRPTSGANAPVSAIDAIVTRRSVRAFLPKPVAPELVERVLELGARAPSGSNIQPWQVLVLTGTPLATLGTELKALEASGQKGEPAYTYYPKAWREPYLARRRKVGWDLYAALGIAKTERERMATQHARNLSFFDAPVGLFFAIDRDLELGSWLDYGMFLENIMIAARAFGLDTCPQAAFVPYAGHICQRLGIGETQMLVCGMALGYADPDAPENHFATEREPLANFVRRVENLA